MLLSACATGPGGMFSSEDEALLTPEEREIRRVETERKQQAAAIGCALGGGVAFLASTQTDTSPLAKGLMTIGGCLVGGLAGFAAGDYLNARTQEYASEQAGYRALIQGAEEDVARYRAFNRTASQIVSQQREKVARLNAEYTSGVLTKEQYEDQIASADNNVEILENQKKSLEESLGYMRGDVDRLRQAGVSTSELESKIAELERERDTLQGRIVALSGVYGDVPPEVSPLTS